MRFKSKNNQRGSKSIGVKPLPAKEALDYNRLCRRYAQSCCTHGSECWFIHHESLRLRALDEKRALLWDSGFSGPWLCYFYCTGATCYQMKNCKFVHNFNVRKQVRQYLATKESRVAKGADVSTSSNWPDGNNGKKTTDILKPSSGTNNKEISDIVDSSAATKKLNGTKNAQTTCTRNAILAPPITPRTPLTTSFVAPNNVKERLAATQEPNLPPTLRAPECRPQYGPKVKARKWTSLAQHETKIALPRPTSYTAAAAVAGPREKQEVSSSSAMTRESGPASGLLVMYEANNMGVQAPRREITKGPTKMPFLVKDPLKTSARSNHYTSPSKPSYHAWDKIPSHWEHWVYLNLDTHNRHRIIALRREIRAGALDQGAMPKCFDKKEINASPAEFQWFALFPYDIAHIVWEYAAADESRREIRVEFEYSGLDERDRSIDTWWKPKTLTSPLLRTCQLSRKAYLGLQLCEKILETRWAPPNVYFNFEKDRLFINTECADQYTFMVQHIRRCEKERFQRLALPIRDFIKGDEQKVSRFLKLFCNLKELVLYIGDGREDHYAVHIEEHFRKITKMVISYWKKWLPSKQIPVIKLETIAAEKAHYFGIDGILW